MAWYQRRKDEQVQEYNAKRRQKALLTGAGVLGVAGGLARAPWAAKHAVRAAQKVAPATVGAGLARVPTGVRSTLGAIERRSTAASTPLAIGSGATGSLSSLTYASRLKRETKKEGEKLGITKASLVELAKRAQPTPPSEQAQARARRRSDDSWRAHVSPGAQVAHDVALPPYARRYAGQAASGAGTAALGVGAAGLGGHILASHARSGRLAPLATGTALAAGGLGTAGVGGRYAYERNQRRRAIGDKQQAIRARGHQRGLDAVG